MPQLRTIPINVAIPVTTEVMPYESAEAILRAVRAAESLPGLPAAFDGYTLLQLSDIHADLHPPAVHAMVETVRDHARPAFHDALGVDIEWYDQEVFRKTSEISKQVFPMELDIDHPRWMPGLKRLQKASADMDRAKKTGGISGALGKAWAGTRAALAFASLYTGLLPYRHGFYRRQFYSLGPQNTTMAEMFSDAGYTTGGWVTIGYLTHAYGMHQGLQTGQKFDDHADGESAKQVTAASARFTGLASAPPFLAFLHYYDVHAPYTPPAPVPPRAAVAARVGRRRGGSRARR